MDNNPAGTASNGVSTPLFADGVVLQAADLSLGQAAQNAQLARMRTLLHGWGVVAGLIPTVRGEQLVISAGYGILPGGGELYLSTELSIQLPTAGELITHCSGVAGGCELPTGEELTPQAEAGPVWLAVGAGGHLAAPRGVVLTGCEHPANAAMPTRWCHQVDLYLLCELPESHQVPEPRCADLTPYVCADPPLPLPLPDPPPPQSDLLVLGRLLPEGDTVQLQLLDRHPLLPNHLLQAWLRSCLCPRLTDPEPEPEPDPDDPRDMIWEALLVLMRRRGMDQLPEETRPTTVFNMYKSEPLIRGSVVDRLTQADIPGPAQFMSSNVRLLLQVTGMTRAALQDAMRELSWIRERIPF